MQEKIDNKVLAEIHKEDVKIIKELKKELSIYKELVVRYQKIINLDNIDKISKEIDGLEGLLFLKNLSERIEIEELMMDEK